MIDVIVLAKLAFIANTLVKRIINNRTGAIKIIVSVGVV